MNFQILQTLETYLPFELNSFSSFLKVYLFLFFVISLRYIFFVGLSYLFFWKNKFMQFNKLHSLDINPLQIRNEIKWSVISTFIFSFSGYLMGFLWQNNMTQIYLRFDQYGYFYLFLSFLIMTLLHEVYFYVTHVFMHQPRFFKKIHSVHHESKDVSPWASFSFHPWETLVHALFVPAMICIFPVHPVVLVGYFTFMTLTAISNHLGIEIISSNFIKNHFISGTHHSLHHKKYKYNYGLYYCFMDRLFGTEFAEEE